jgi:hypothetical protein
MITIGAIAFGFWLARADPEAIALLIVSIFFAVLPGRIVRRRVAEMKAQGESLSFGDRIAFFLCLSLFTVPIGFVLALIVLVRSG